MRTGLVSLTTVVGLLAFGCTRDKNADLRPLGDDAVELRGTSRMNTSDTPIARPVRRGAEPVLPLVEAPAVSLVRGIGGGWDLEADGLPAISGDGERIVVVLRGAVMGPHRRLAIEIIVADSGDTERVIDILTPVTDLKRGKEPAEKIPARRLARAMKALGSGRWRTMVQAESVLPDGWLRCPEGRQRFDLGDLEIDYREPRLSVVRDGLVVLDESFSAWRRVSKSNRCDARSFIVSAAADMKHGRLALQLEHCGDCGVEPHWEVVSFGKGKSRL